MRNSPGYSLNSNSNSFCCSGMKFVKHYKAQKKSNQCPLLGAEPSALPILEGSRGALLCQRLWSLDSGAALVLRSHVRKISCDHVLNGRVNYWQVERCIWSWKSAEGTGLSNLSENSPCPVLCSEIPPVCYLPVYVIQMCSHAPRKEDEAIWKSILEHLCPLFSVWNRLFWVLEEMKARRAGL